MNCYNFINFLWLLVSKLRPERVWQHLDVLSLVERSYLSVLQLVLSLDFFKMINFFERVIVVIVVIRLFRWLCDWSVFYGSFIKITMLIKTTAGSNLTMLWEWGLNLRIKNQFLFRIDMDGIKVWDDWFI